MTTVKTLKIQEATHTELTKVKGAITSETGKDATYDDAIMETIKAWKKQKTGRPDVSELVKRDS